MKHVKRSDLNNNLIIISVCMSGVGYLLVSLWITREHLTLKCGSVRQLQQLCMCVCVHMSEFGPAFNTPWIWPVNNSVKVSIFQYISLLWWSIYFAVWDLTELNWQVLTVRWLSLFVQRYMRPVWQQRLELVPALSNNGHALIRIMFLS